LTHEISPNHICIYVHKTLTVRQQDQDNKTRNHVDKSTPSSTNRDYMIYLEVGEEAIGESIKKILLYQSSVNTFMNNR